MTNPLFDLTGDVAVITGAGRGIGEGMAQTLADAGCNVVCASRSLDQISRVADAINASNSSGRAIAHAADVTSAEDMDALAQRAVDEFGKLDIWVNNAGGSLVSAPLIELDEAEWDKTLATNLTSVFHGVRAACKHFGEGSRIVNTSSLAAEEPFPGSGHYSAAKAGVLMLTKTLAHERADALPVRPGISVDDRTVHPAGRQTLGAYLPVSALVACHRRHRSSTMR